MWPDDISTPRQCTNISSSTSRKRNKHRGLKLRNNSETNFDSCALLIAQNRVGRKRAHDPWYDWHYDVEEYCDRDSSCPCNAEQCLQIGSTSTRNYPLPCQPFKLHLNTRFTVSNCHDGLCKDLYFINDPFFESTIWLI